VSRPTSNAIGERPTSPRRNQTDPRPQTIARPEGLIDRTKKPSRPPGELLQFLRDNLFGPGGVQSKQQEVGPELCERPGIFRHPTNCNKFYECFWDMWTERYTLHVFNCAVRLIYDENITACNWHYSKADCADRPDAELEQLLREADRTQFPEGLLDGYPAVRQFLGL